MKVTWANFHSLGTLPTVKMMLKIDCFKPHANNHKIFFTVGKVQYSSNF